jgi:hypothetical protein
MNSQSQPVFVSVRKMAWGMTLLATSAVGIASPQIIGGAGCGFGSAPSRHLRRSILATVAPVKGSETPNIP